MSGDAPVRFCEGLEVKLLRSTHLYSFIARRPVTPEEVEPAWREEVFIREQ
ncbi:hypothetical protein [Pelodictyon luteolum]|uniref:hypothetical protein n=1 Tax=Pelodictyon luteolum TaxID=1100 RepID=UPI002687686F|nr:hypothetical protein [Pelodictyon luteolum]